ncbi:MAG: chemotaxis protein CheX [Acidobacteria bacterium]|nr:chemotaxis protein CheX [Acidobacteriota bacterium]
MSSSIDQKQKKTSLPSAEWTKLLESATREVFEIMLRTPLEPVKTKSNSEEGTQEPALTAMIGLAGQISGVLTVRCTLRAAAGIAEKMLGTKVAENDQSSADAVGEVCNMIAGNFKSKISGLAESCMLSVPTVISGSNYQLHRLENLEYVEVSLEFDDFSLDVALEMRV